MQDLENAVREVLEARAYQPNPRFLGALVNLRVMFDEHMAKPKHDEWGQYIGDDLAKANAKIEWLKGELSQEKTARDSWKETANRWRDSFSVELVAERDEVKRLQGEITTMHALHAVLRNELRSAQDHKDGAIKEVARLQGELASANEDLSHLANQKEMAVQTFREIYEAAGISGPPLSSSSDMVIRKLRDHEAAMRFKRYIADIVGIDSCLCDVILTELKAKVSQLTIQAKDAAEFRAAWAKLKGMLE